jgi:hypothetical protein
MAWKVNNNNGSRVNQIQCSLCQVPIIYIEQVPKQKIELLMDSYPHQEWASYLVGYISEKGNIFVEDLVIPPHAYASGGAAEIDRPDYNKETGKYNFHIPDKCVGFLHSHNSMGAFHSGTDDAHVDKNYPVSITVAKHPTSSNIDYDCVSFALTPCGKATTGKPVVKYVAPKPLFDTVTWLADAKSAIDKGGKRESAKHKLSLPPGKELIRNMETGKFVKHSRKFSSCLVSGEIYTDDSGHVLSEREVADFLSGNK